jgi:hypothetical protein
LDKLSKTPIQCYLCDAPAETRDHIPPKGLFPRPRPSNLHTLPCCEVCNDRASGDDEYFRLAASSLVNRNAAGSKAWQRTVQSTLKKRRIGKLIDELHESIKPTQISTPFGSLDVVQIGARADVISRVLVRITKGFLYLTHPEIDRSRLDFHITQIHQFKLESIVASGVAQAFTHYSIGEGVYRHWRALSADDIRKGLWVHMFYEAAVWMVDHRPGDGRITLHGAEGWEQR